LSDQGLYITNPKLMFTLEGIQLLLFPVYYLYAKYLEGFSEKFSNFDLLHLFPFLVYKIFLLPYYFMTHEQILTFQNSLIIEDHPFQYIVLNWIIIIQGLVYMILVLNVTKKYELRIKEMYSSISKIKLDWLKNATYLALFITIVFMIENILQLSGIYISESFGFSSLMAAIYIYTIGYMGLSRSGVFTELVQIESMDLDNNIKQSNIERYEKSGLSIENAEMYQKKLLSIMESEKPYMNSNLTLGDLAALLSISSHNLSEIINTKEKKNFFDFINHYRIEETKRELINPKKGNLTILAIAMDAGFNSKTSFNTLFKKYVGMTPTQYRDSTKSE
ncbi:MAG: AraC family transcriptional regulator, partial [Melioribacteraceae bacterium]|nr:AraC family transcriptional regulator [Melioribacteraceae bacterium]